MRSRRGSHVYVEIYIYIYIYVYARTFIYIYYICNYWRYDAHVRRQIIELARCSSYLSSSPVGWGYCGIPEGGRVDS